MIQGIQGVYQIKNKINGRVYIGGTKDIFKRWDRHLYDLTKKRHVNHKLQSDYNEYGIEVFEFSVVEVVHGTRKDFLEREQHWIDSLGGIEDNYNVLSYSSYEYVDRTKATLDDKMNFELSIEQKEKLKHNLFIFFSHKINDIGEDAHALSQTWFVKNKDSFKQLQNNMKNFTGNIMKEKKVYWTTFTSYQKQLEVKGLIKRFVRIEEVPKGKCNVLIFAANLYANTFMKQQESIDDDKYAVSVFFQWLRNVSNLDKRIDIYIPSSRMRTLIQNEIDSWK